MRSRPACAITCALLLLLVPAESTGPEEPYLDTDVDTQDWEDLLLLQVGLQLQSPYQGSSAVNNVTGESQPQLHTSLAWRLLGTPATSLEAAEAGMFEGTVVVFPSRHAGVVDSSMQRSIVIHGREMMESRTTAALFLLLTASFGLMCFCGNSKPEITAPYSEPGSQDHQLEGPHTNLRKDFSLAACYFVVFMDAFGFGIYAPLVPVLAKTFAFSAHDVASLLAAFSLAQALNTPVLGYLSDFYGRRPVLMATLAVEALAYLVLSCASNYGGLLVGYAMAGAACATIGVSNAYLSEISSEEEKPVRLAYSSGSIAFGLMLGPLAGAALSHQGFATTVQCCSLLSTLNLLLVWCFLAEVKTSVAKSGDRDGSMLPFPRLSGLSWILYLVTFLGAAGVAANETCGALFIMDSYFVGHPSAAVESTRFFALNMVVSGITVVVTTVLVFPRVMQWLKQRNTMLLGGILRIIGYAGLAFAPTKSCFLIAAAVVVVGDNLCSPNLSALLTEVAGQSNYGMALGAMAAFEAAARVLDPVIFANLFERVSHGAPYLAVAVMGMISLAMWLGVYHAHHANAQTQEA